jgi:hypothetical protein
MLNDLVAVYGNKSKEELQYLGVLITLMGFVFALFADRSRGMLSRAPYFAWFSMLFLLSVGQQFAWRASFQAMSIGLSGMFIGLNLLAAMAFGYLFGIQSLARARDAFGNGLYAILAVIPLANLVLLLKRTNNGPLPDRDKKLPKLSGGLLVSAGMAMIAAAAGLAVMLYEVRDAIRVREHAALELQLSQTEALIRSRGLEAALAQLAEDEVKSQTENDIISLTSVEYGEEVIRYNYKIATGAWFFNDEFREMVIEYVCSLGYLTNILQAGARIEQVFYQPNGIRHGAVVIIDLDCDL